MHNLCKLFAFFALSLFCRGSWWYFCYYLGFSWGHFGLYELKSAFHLFFLLGFVENHLDRSLTFSFRSLSLSLSLSMAISTSFLSLFLSPRLRRLRLTKTPPSPSSLSASSLCSFSVSLSIAHVDQAPSPEFDFAEEIPRLCFFRSRINEDIGLKEKLTLLDSDSRVRVFFGSRKGWVVASNVRSHPPSASIYVSERILYAHRSNGLEGEDGGLADDVRRR